MSNILSTVRDAILNPMEVREETITNGLLIGTMNFDLEIGDLE